MVVGSGHCRVVISGADAAPLLDFLDQAYQRDFQVGDPYVVTNKYSAQELEEIRSKETYAVDVPSPKYIKDAYRTPTPVALPVTADVMVYTSPDHSRNQILADINSTQSSFSLHIYQITDMGLCDALLQLHFAGKDVYILASHDIYSSGDSSEAHKCYTYLYGHGLTVRLTPAYYTYSHQKYWVVDNGALVGLSTGNWSPTDARLPLLPGNAFPPFPDKDWQRVNRDYDFRFKSKAIADVYLTTLKEDWARGSDFQPAGDA